MIVVLVPVIIAGAVMLTQALHDIDQNQLSSGAAKTVANAPSSLPAPSPKAATLRKPTAQAARSKPIQHAKLAPQSAPNPKDQPSERHASLQPTRNEIDNAGATRAATTDASSSGGDTTNANVRTVQELVAAATSVAEKMSSSRPVPDSKSKADNRLAVASNDSPQNTASQPGNPDALFVICIARPNVNSVASLHGTVAIDARNAWLMDNVQATIAAAGATEVKLSVSQTSGIDRVVSGEVPAAVVTVVSSEAADGFPAIAGYKTFRIPFVLR